jgi:hypothetical protein
VVSQLHGFDKETGNGARQQVSGNPPGKVLASLLIAVKSCNMTTPEVTPDRCFTVHAYLCDACAQVNGLMTALYINCHHVTTCSPT